jgi:hypothetical protein
MRIRLATILVPVLAVVLAACGGGSDDSKRTSSNSKKIDRSGYFTDEQSEQLNPPIAEWNTAANKYFADEARCNKEAERKYNAGASPRASIQCHLVETKAILVATQGLIDAVDGLDGDWRPACEKKIDGMATYLERQRVAIEALQADWLAYANNKPTPKIQQHASAAGKLAYAFGELTVPFSEACYTKADRDEAAKDAKDSTDAKTDSGDGATNAKDDAVPESEQS